MKRQSFTRPARSLGAGVLVLLASATCPIPASAEEDDRGWFGVITDLLKRPEGAPVDVPLRKSGRSESPAPAAAPDALREENEAPPPPPSSTAQTPAPEPSPAAQAPEPAPPVQTTEAQTAEPAIESQASEPASAPQTIETQTPEPTSVAQTPEPSPVVQPPEPSAPATLPARVEGAELAHVDRAVRDLAAEVRLLRDALGARDTPHEAAPLEDRTPVHLYVKTLEVIAKVTASQRRLGVSPGGTVQAPFKDIDAADVLVNVEHARNELARLTTHAGVERAIVPAALEPAPAPSLVYKRLADASFLLDALRGGPLTGADVYHHSASALGDVALIAAKLGAAAGRAPPRAQAARTPIAVAQLLLRATYKAVSLQTRLGMDASIAPAVSLAHATPGHAYDMTNLLLAELARIKLHLGVDEARPEFPEPPAEPGLDHAFAVVQLIVSNLDAASQAASD